MLHENICKRQANPAPPAIHNESSKFPDVADGPCRLARQTMSGSREPRTVCRAAVGEVELRSIRGRGPV